MARPTLRGHRKFKRLMRILNLPEPYVLGLLQMIWDAAYESGDDVLGDSIDVESVAGWPGERGVLTQALLDAGGEQVGFIEPANGRPDAYQVHDLWQHAPRYVLRRAERETQRKAAGLTISEIRRAAGSIGGKQTASKRTPVATEKPATVQQEGSNRQQMVVTPAPAPAPKRIPISPEAPHEVRRPEANDGFTRFWSAWSRKVGRDEAIKAWKKVPESEREAAIVGAAAYSEAHKGREQYMKYPQGWLNGRRWKDDAASWVPLFEGNGNGGPSTNPPKPPPSTPEETARRELIARAEAEANRKTDEVRARYKAGKITKEQGMTEVARIEREVAEKHGVEI